MPRSIDEFYSDKNPEEDSRIFIRGIGGLAGRVQSGSGEDLEENLPDPEKRMLAERLNLRREETNHFTEFLRGKYFENS